MQCNGIGNGHDDSKISSPQAMRCGSTIIMYLTANLHERKSDPTKCKVPATSVEPYLANTYISAEI